MDISALAKFTVRIRSKEEQREKNLENFQFDQKNKKKAHLKMVSRRVQLLKRLTSLKKMPHSLHQNNRRDFLRASRGLDRPLLILDSKV
jgi:hypothetical protein